MLKMNLRVRKISSLANFTVDVVHYKGLIIREVINIPMDKLDKFQVMIAKFIQKSQEDDATVDMIMRKIDAAMDDHANRVGIWTFEKDGEMVGYMFMEVGISEYEKVVAFVHNLYLSPSIRRLQVFTALDPIMVRWARSKGASHIRFMTTRSPRAFYKKLPEKWKPYGFVFNRPV